MPYHILVHGKTCITVIFDLSILIYGAGVVQNMAILEVKTGLLWQACWGVRTQPGNLLMRHITSHYMAEHVFGPFLTCPCTFMAQGGVQNMVIWGIRISCYGRLVTKWVNSSRKCLVCHIHPIPTASLLIFRHNMCTILSET